MIGIRSLQIPGLPTKAARKLYVYVPRDYERSDRRYPVLYMFDGHNVFFDSHATYGKSWGMKEYLERSELPLIVVAVACNPEGNRRLNEYGPWDFEIPELGKLKGLGRVTMDWITKTLKPAVDRRLRTLPDRAHTLIAGSSMGGLMALYAVTAYSETFSRAAALSPSLWAAGEHLPELLSPGELTLPVRIYLDLGTAEIPPEVPDLAARLFDAAASLSRAGADTAAMVIPGAPHNEAAWEKRIPYFLPYLLAEAQKEAPQKEEAQKEETKKE